MTTQWAIEKDTAIISNVEHMLQSELRNKFVVYRTQKPRAYRYHWTQKIQECTRNMYRTGDYADTVNFWAS